MTRSLKILLLTVSLLLLCPQPVRAIDPVTIAILAPIAIKVAQAASPYVLRAAKNTGTGLVKMGKDLFELIYLPYGLGKMTFGYPFGGFRSGAVYAIKGCVAPCKLIVHTLLLPVYMIGVEVNM